MKSFVTKKMSTHVKILYKNAGNTSVKINIIFILLRNSTVTCYQHILKMNQFLQKPGEEKFSKGLK